MTIAAFLVGASLVGSMAWLERRPRKSLNAFPFPTTPLLFIGAIIGLIALVHLVNLWGLHTGRGR